MSISVEEYSKLCLFYYDSKHLILLQTPNLNFQSNSLKKLDRSLARTLSLCVEKNPTDIIAAELRLGLTYLDDILGITTPEEILNNIFSKFCIGK